MSYLIKNCKTVIDGKATRSDIAFSGKFIENPDSSKDYEVIDGSESIVVPGFIDTHIHGCGGYGTEDCTQESILNMSSILSKAGVTTFFPTLYTDLLDKMERGEDAIVEASAKTKGAKIGGIHSEGPFISPDRIGAQNPLGRRNADISVFDSLLSHSSGMLKAMTIAPEIPNAEIVIKEALKNNVVLLQGHTNATYEESIRGKELGVRHATHLFNAMTGLHHRKPGVVGAVLSSDDMTAEIIGDGLHVHPAALKVSLNAKGADNIIIITDSLKPTMQENGPFYANDVEVEIANGLWVTKGKPDLIQGSALTMHKAFKNLLSWKVALEDAVKLTSSNAARIYNLDRVGKIQSGYLADLVMLNEKTLDIEKVIINGVMK